MSQPNLLSPEGSHGAIHQEIAPYQKRQNNSFRLPSVTMYPYLTTYRTDKKRILPHHAMYARIEFETSVTLAVRPLAANKHLI